MDNVISIVLSVIICMMQTYTFTYQTLELLLHKIVVLTLESIVLIKISEILGKPFSNQQLAAAQMVCTMSY